MNVNLAELAKEIHAAAVEKGFWDVADAENKHLAKMVSEIGEIVQADRAGIMYEVEHEGAKPEGVIAEMADFVMMVLDLYAKYAVDFDAVAEECIDSDGLKSLVAVTDTYMIAMFFAAKLLECAMCNEGELAITIHVADAWAEAHGFDLWAVIRQKMEYNKSRPALHGRAY